MKAEATVMDDYVRCEALDDLKCRAVYGEDIRWDEVSRVIAEKQAEISFQAGYDTGYSDGRMAGIKEVVKWVESVKPRINIEAGGVFTTLYHWNNGYLN